MEEFKDLTGMTFNHLTVILYAGRKNKSNKRHWLVECDCENKTRKEVSETSLKNGNTKSCGCIRKKTTEQYKLELEEFNKEYNTNIELKDNVEYIGAIIKITHICTCGKEWNVDPHTILTNKTKSCGLCFTFKDWCLSNNRQDILNRWDYELNNCSPDDISYCPSKKYYFKCPKGIHKSELKDIHSFVSSIHEGTMICKACNSFGNYLVSNHGENAIEKYWDYELNKNINIWRLDKSSGKKVFIKCINKSYHNSYPIRCADFVDGKRCPYCTNRCGKVHSLDSLGALYPQVLDIWSNKNEKSPYEYAPMSAVKVYWKCPENKHEDYPRSIVDSNKLNFRCPECQYSKGEEAISNYFINKGFIKIDQEEFNQLINEDKYSKNYYIPQKEFNSLIGTGGGLLSYDFNLPRLNLLIEYHGIQHEKFTPGLHKTYEDFLKQVEHDKRKCEYALNNNIKLLVIWYWDFDRIEEILEKEVFIHI